MKTLKKHGIFLTDQKLRQGLIEKVYGAEHMAAVRDRLEIPEKVYLLDELLENPELAQRIQIVMTTWGMPTLDAALLDRLPKLEAVFYAAGSVRGFVTPESWKRGVRIFNAATANAVPVAEFAAATILLSLKQFWRCAQLTRENRNWDASPLSTPGAYKTEVGLVSIGQIGRRVRELLASTDLRPIAYDPFFSPKEAEALGIELVSLEALFQRAQVVSLHTPLLKETEGMVGHKLLQSMRPAATLINTARGALIDESALVDVLRQRPDLTAILDVTWPEPPAPESPLFTVPNIIITPHIAGSQGLECQRMAAYMVDELEHYLTDQPLAREITEATSALRA